MGYQIIVSAGIQEKVIVTLSLSLTFDGRLRQEFKMMTKEFIGDLCVCVRAVSVSEGGNSYEILN